MQTYSSLLYSLLSKDMSDRVLDKRKVVFLATMLEALVHDIYDAPTIVDSTFCSRPLFVSSSMPTKAVSLKDNSRVTQCRQVVSDKLTTLLGPSWCWVMIHIPALLRFHYSHPHTPPIAFITQPSPQTPCPLFHLTSLAFPPLRLPIPLLLRLGPNRKRPPISTATAVLRYTRGSPPAG